MMDYKMNTASMWHEDATYALISIWGDSDIQEGFDGTKRNSSVYAVVKRRLDELGYNFEVKQVVNKCKYLRKQYSTVKEERKRTGGNGLLNWVYFDKMDTIFGGDKKSNIPVYPSHPVLDTSVPGLSTSNFGEHDDGLSECSDVSFPSEDDTDQVNQDGSVPSEDADANPDVPGQSEETDTAQGACNNKQKRKRDTTSPIPEIKKPRINTLINSFANAMRQVNKEFEIRFFQHLREMERERMHWEELREEREERRLLAQEERNNARQIQFLQAIGNMFRSSTEHSFQKKYTNQVPPYHQQPQSSMPSTEHFPQGQRTHPPGPPSMPSTGYPEPQRYHHHAPSLMQSTGLGQPQRHDHQPPPLIQSTGHSQPQGLNHQAPSPVQSTEQGQSHTHNHQGSPSVESAQYTSPRQTTIKHEHFHLHHRPKSTSSSDLMNFLSPSYI